MNLKISSLKNAVISFFSMLILAITNLILIRYILIEYGSDANGIYATVNQTVSILTLLEAGFALAINVALFKPFSQNNEEEFKSIVKAASNIFYVISLLVLILGITFSVVYPLFIKTSIVLSEIRWIYIYSVIPLAINYGFITKYRIMLQVKQKEYLINLVNTIFLVITFIFNMSVIFFDGSLKYVVLSSLIVNIIKCITLYIVYKSNFRHFSLKGVSPNYKLIKGTGDVFVQKITSILYTVIPIFFISVSIGTTILSVYVIYSSVLGIVKQITYTFINAPQQAFGLKISIKGAKSIKNQFKIYQLITLIILTVLMIPTFLLFEPFINLYTDGNIKFSYDNELMLYLFIIITILEIVHLPSGNIINLNGEFKISRNIQIIAIICMVVISIIGSYFQSVEGILLGKLICNVVLSIAEIYYCYKKILNISLYFLFKNIMTLMLSFLFVTTIFNYSFDFEKINTYFDFVIWGFVVLGVSLLIVLLISFISFYKLLKINFESKFFRKRVER